VVSSMHGCQARSSLTPSPHPIFDSGARAFCRGAPVVGAAGPEETKSLPSRRTSATRAMATRPRRLWPLDQHPAPFPLTLLSQNIVGFCTKLLKCVSFNASFTPPC